MAFSSSDSALGSAAVATVANPAANAVATDAGLVGVFGVGPGAVGSGGEPTGADSRAGLQKPGANTTAAHATAVDVAIKGDAGKNAFGEIEAFCALGDSTSFSIEIKKRGGEREREGERKRETNLTVSVGALYNISLFCDTLSFLCGGKFSSLLCKP